MSQTTSRSRGVAEIELGVLFKRWGLKGLGRWVVHLGVRKSS